MRSRSRLPRGVLVATGPVVLVAAGIAGYLSFGYSPWTAVAMTLLTLTTVGLASDTHLSTGALVFTAGLALLGVSLFIAIVGLAATAISYTQPPARGQPVLRPGAGQPRR